MNEFTIENLSKEGFSFTAINEIFSTKEEFREFFLDIGPQFSNSHFKKLRELFNEYGSKLTSDDLNALLVEHMNNKGTDVPLPPKFYSNAVPYFYEAVHMLPGKTKLIDDLFNKMKDPKTFRFITLELKDGNDYTKCIEMDPESLKTYVEFTPAEKEIFDHFYNNGIHHKNFSDLISLHKICKFCEDNHFDTAYLKTLDFECFKMINTLLNGHTVYFDDEAKKVLAFLETKPDKETIKMVSKTKEIPIDFLMDKDFVERYKTELKKYTPKEKTLIHSILSDKEIPEDLRKIFIANFNKYSLKEMEFISKYLYNVHYNVSKSIPIAPELFDISYSERQKAIIWSSLISYYTDKISAKITDYVTPAHTPEQMTEINRMIELGYSAETLRKMSDPALKPDDIHKIAFSARTGKSYKDNDEFVKESNKELKNFLQLYRELSLYCVGNMQLFESFVNFITEMNEKYNVNIDMDKCLHSDIYNFYPFDPNGFKNNFELALKAGLDPMSYYDGKSTKETRNSIINEAIMKDIKDKGSLDNLLNEATEATVKEKSKNEISIKIKSQNLYTLVIGDDNLPF